MNIPPFSSQNKFNKPFRYTAWILMGILVFQGSTAAVFGADYPANNTFKYELKVIQPPDNTLKDVPEKGLQTADLAAISIDIDNPSKNPIVSARLWLNYPKDKVEGVEILKDSEFNLDTPGEVTIDNETGLIKIGRGYTGGSLKGAKIHFATIVFRVVSETPNDPVTLKYNGFSAGKDSKAVIHVVDNYLPIRVMPASEPKPFSFKVNLIAGGADSTVSIPVVDDKNSLTPPANIIACSDGSEVNFTWDLPLSEIEGIFIYYSPKQGVYLHRKALPKVTAFAFTGLTPGSNEYYKFSSFKGTQESVQTQEFAVPIGNLPCQKVYSDLSSLTVLKDSVIDTGNAGTANQIPKPDKTPETGPNTLILSLLSLVFIGAFFGIAAILRKHA